MRQGPDRVLAGVCSGVAEYLHLDTTLVRIVFVLLALIPPSVGVILYFVLWFLMERSTPGGARPSAGERLRKMGDDFRREFGRGSKSSQPGPAGAPSVSYSEPVATPPGAPATPSGSVSGHGGGRHSGGMWAGVILIVLGVYFLLDNLGYLSFVRWDIFWPVVLIAIGLLVLLRRYR